jgi:hypothetical protein
MSKMDNLRAMREARYEQAAARAGRSTKRQSTPKPTMPQPTAPPATALQVDADLPEPEAALCGHRAISGRTCTREAGHAAKSHRYS